MRIVSILVGLCILAMSGPVRADTLQVLLHKPGKKETVVVVLRQIFDLEAGFDSYFLETYSAPANRLVRQYPLGARMKRKCRNHGQYELYMLQVAVERDEILARLAGKGFVAPDWSTLSERFTRSLEIPSETGLKVEVESGRSREEIMLGSAKGGKERLFRLPCPESVRTADSPNCIVDSGIRQLALLDRGRMLAAVIRVHAPSTPARVHDEIRFFPLARALRALKTPYPLKIPVVREDSKPEEPEAPETGEKSR